MSEKYLGTCILTIIIKLKRCSLILTIPLPAGAMTELSLNLIVAFCANRGIGHQGSIPWTLKKDMSHFSKITKQTDNPNSMNAVIMGRKTWDSLPNKFKPLPGRYNVVLTKNTSFASTLITDQSLVNSSTSLDDAIELLKTKKSKGEIENIWVIGGSSVYEEALNSPLCDKVYVTEVFRDFTCDTFFPSLGDNFKLIEDPRYPTEVLKEEELNFQFKVFQKIK